MAEKSEKSKPEVIEHINDFPSESEQKAEPETGGSSFGFKTLKKDNSRRKRIYKILTFLFVFIALVLAVYVIFKRENNAPEPEKKSITVPIPEGNDHVFVNDTSIASSQATEEEDAGNPDGSIKGLIGRSENYQIKDIAIGGGSVVLAAEAEALPIRVSSVHTETFLSKDGKETKILISWKTNKLARSDVEYARSGGDEKMLKEDGFGFNHALVLNKLDPSTRYSFIVNASDREGNVAKSNEFAVYTGAKSASVFELISSEMDDIFGWAFKK